MWHLVGVLFGKCGLLVQKNTIQGCINMWKFEVWGSEFEIRMIVAMEMNGGEGEWRGGERGRRGEGYLGRVDALIKVG